MSRLRATLVVVLATALLVGCAAQPGLDQATGSVLQANVSTIADTAAAGDPATALAQLDALEQSVMQASVDGRVSADRSAQILAAIALVRSDLEAMVTRLQPPTPSETPSEGNGNGNGKGNNGNGNGNGNGKDKDD